MMTKQFALGVLIVILWFGAGALEYIGVEICFVGFVGFVIGAKLVIWEYRNDFIY